MNQVTVFLENKEGHLSDLVRTVSSSGANMKALTVADTSAYGLVRIIAQDSAKAILALEESGYRAALTKVLAVNISNDPGSLALLLDVLDDADVNIEYAYCFDQADRALAVLKVREYDKAVSLVEGNSLEIVENI